MKRHNEKCYILVQYQGEQRLFTNSVHTVLCVCVRVCVRKCVCALFCVRTCGHCGAIFWQYNGTLMGHEPS